MMLLGRLRQRPARRLCSERQLRARSRSKRGEIAPRMPRLSYRSTERYHKHRLRQLPAALPSEKRIGPNAIVLIVLLNPEKARGGGSALGIVARAEGTEQQSTGQGQLAAGKLLP